LIADLNRDVACATSEQPLVLVMFDLNGFKVYNDTFGHMAGDVLLTHLGRRLADAVSAHGEAYRLGGDEFCVLLRTTPPQARLIIAGACAALTASGKGFRVNAAFGHVIVPDEARASSLALRMADDRMYVHKGGGRSASARQQTHDVLLTVLRERQPELHEHLAEVGRLAAAVGRRMNIRGEQLDELVRAANLHDVGKAAIPDEVINKVGPLSDGDWAFLRRHTIIGERILASAPALGPVAALVRSSHEYWDGSGYPDALAGDMIPLGSRIICVCDAFQAMVSSRPYAPATSDRYALAELQRNASTQFDPAVVKAFVEEWGEGRGEEASTLVPAANVPVLNAARAL
jgi:diguanylate cyclase (GGDEF)-like protein